MSIKPHVGMLVAKKDPTASYYPCVGVVVNRDRDGCYEIRWYDRCAGHLYAPISYAPVWWKDSFRVIDGDEAKMLQLAYPELCVT